MPRKKKKRNRKPEDNPTLFVFDGSIKYYQHGSLLELYSGITSDEWIQIVNETVVYHIYLECLKDVAYPILNEPWADDDDWYRLQLGVAVSRMRNIDPLLVASINVDEIRREFSDKMKVNAAETVELIKKLKEEQLGLYSSVTNVSDI